MVDGFIVVFVVGFVDPVVVYLVAVAGLGLLCDILAFLWLLLG